MRYKTLGRTGLRVSEVAFGTGTFGTTWGWGVAREGAAQLFDCFTKAGGNFFDCADGYQNGEAETILGELIASERDNVVVSTKYTTAAGEISMLKAGNSRRAMVRSIENSLKRLGTDYVDIFWVHYSDETTPIEEILRAFDDLVSAGKTRYIGFSDFPAWRIARGAAIADLRGWAPISAVQIEYSLAERSAEREFLPMANALDLAVLVWASLGGGMLTGKYRKAERGRRDNGGMIRTIDGEAEDRLFDALDTVATETGATRAQVAIAWVRARAAPGASVIPILGARTVEQLNDNLGALGLSLTVEQVARLSDATAIPLGFPHDIINRDAMRNLHSGGRLDQIDRPMRTIA